MDLVHPTLISDPVQTIVNCLLLKTIALRRNTYGWSNVHSPLSILDKHMTNSWPHSFQKIMTHLSGINYHTSLEYRLFCGFAGIA